MQQIARPKPTAQYSHSVTEYNSGQSDADRTDRVHGSKSLGCVPSRFWFRDRYRPGIMSILSNSGIAVVPFTCGMLILESGPASGFGNFQATPSLLPRGEAITENAAGESRVSR
jgi:hypothetical protein